MKATIGLEWIGEGRERKMRRIGVVFALLRTDPLGAFKGRKPWVAEITGRDSKFGLRRSFLRGKMQCIRSNSKCTRGLELWFVLESGKLYECFHYTSWKRSERFFCEVTSDGDVSILSDEDANAKIPDSDDIELSRWEVGDDVRPVIKATLSIGSSRRYRPWVAEVVGSDPRYKYDRRFLRPSALGDKLTFILSSGRFYQVKERNESRFCCVTDGGEVRVVEEEEVCSWLKGRLELTS